MTVEEVIEALRPFNQRCEVVITQIGCHDPHDYGLINEVVGYYDNRDKTDPHQIVRIIGY